MKPNPQNSLMLWLTAYLTLFGTALGTLIGRPFDLNFVSILGVYLLIGLFMAFQAKVKSNSDSFIYIITLTAVTILLHFLKVESGLFLVLFFVISAQAMMMLPGIWGYLWIGILAVISGISFMLSEGIQNALLLMLVYGGGYLFFGIFGRALMDATYAKEESKRLYQELQESIQRLEELAATRERSRLAREMHDSIGHRLTVSAVQLEGAQRLVEKDPHKSKEMIGIVREQVREALTELRGTVAALRQPIEMDLPIEQALKRLTAGFEEASDLDIQLSISLLEPITQQHQQVIYRTVQESLTNIQRHAEANQAWIILSVNASSTALKISDNGKGFPAIPSERGFGLRGIMERVSLAGGTCSFSKHNSGGAQIQITLPRTPGVTHD